MKEKQIVRVESKITGGHLALKNPETKNAFTNKMTEAMAVKLRPDDDICRAPAGFSKSSYRKNYGIGQTLYKWWYRCN